MKRLTTIFLEKNVLGLLRLGVSRTGAAQSWSRHFSSTFTEDEPAEEDESPIQLNKIYPEDYPPHGVPKGVYEQLLSTTAARLGLNDMDVRLFRQATTHQSFLSGRLPTNARLTAFGHELLQTRTTEAVYVRYPRLPVDSLTQTVYMYNNDTSLSAWGRSVGLHKIMRWRTNEFKDSELAVKPILDSKDAFSGEKKVLARAVEAVVAAVYHERSTAGAYAFIDKFLLSRQIDLQATLNIPYPKTLLTRLMRRQKRPLPESRLLNESGRFSSTSIFRVGVFSGDELLAYGEAQSIKLAEVLAAKRALQEYFLTELKQLPTYGPDGKLSRLEIEDTPPL